MSTTNTNNKLVRVYMDGCFDLFHYGHGNAIRQAKEMGDFLVVGIHSNDDIARNKGKAVYTEMERYKLIRAIRWIDEVIENVTYFPDVNILDENNCEFCVHGDDIVQAANGVNSYQNLQSAGRFREFKRTTGVSTTDLIKRILDNFDEEDVVASKLEADENNQTSELSMQSTGFVPTASRLAQFMSSSRPPQPGEKIIYFSGCFDFIHHGHVEFLEKVYLEGTYIIVGVYSDEVVRLYKGRNYPIMNLQERILNVLSLRNVMDVVIGAPYSVSCELMDQLHVDLVCHGKTFHPPNMDDSHRHVEAIRRGKFKLINCGCDVTTARIIKRIQEQKLLYLERNRTKEERDMNINLIVQSNNLDHDTKMPLDNVNVSGHEIRMPLDNVNGSDHDISLSVDSKEPSPDDHNNIHTL